MRALISVSDKTGVVDFAKNLKALGWEVIATGGTMKLLRESGVEVLNISDVTGFPEICDGRVKTLHPAVHGGLLARRDVEEHVEALRANGQIAFQYVDADGKPSMDIAANPNGSRWAIEGITSPDGRVLGKMGHTERRGENIARNISGEKFQPLFEGGVAYFK